MTFQRNCRLPEGAFNYKLFQIFDFFSATDRCFLLLPIAFCCLVKFNLQNKEYCLLGTLSTKKQRFLKDFCFFLFLYQFITKKHSIKTPENRFR